MYVVTTKKSKKLLHINPAPLSQELEGTDVYHAFDPKKMEIGRWEGPVLPEHFEVDKKGQVVELSVEKRIKQGLVVLGPHEKLEKGEIVEKSPTEAVADGQKSRDEVKEQTIQRLRSEVGAYLQCHKTPRGYRLDDLARQKASFSAPFRHLTDDDERKKELLEAGLIYPDAVLDEILAEVGKIQSAYRAAKKAVTAAFDKGQPVEKWEAVSLQDHLPGAKKKKAPRKTRARKKTPSKKKPAKKKTPKRGS